MDLSEGSSLKWKGQAYPLPMMYSAILATSSWSSSSLSGREAAREARREMSSSTSLRSLKSICD
ncbi:MAG: hypothetical protein QXF90_07940, partial [Thermofilaceae archaeon]